MFPNHSPRDVFENCHGGALRLDGARVSAPLSCGVTCCGAAESHSPGGRAGADGLWEQRSSRGGAEEVLGGTASPASEVHGE